MTEPARLIIDTGQTTVDWFGLTGRDPHVHLVLHVDAGRFWSLMRNAVA